MEPDAPQSSPGPALNCFRGAPAPPGVVTGYARFVSLEDDARRDIWRALAPVMLDPDAETTPVACESFCDDHDIEPSALGEVLGALRFLFEGAGALNLEREQLVQDLARLGGPAGVADELLRHYDEVKGHVRHRLVEQTLADHGCVLTGIDWRIDQVTASDRGVDLSVSVVLLTLRYDDGGDDRRLTLQLTPDALLQLKAFTDRFS